MSSSSRVGDGLQCRLKSHLVAKKIIVKKFFFFFVENKLLKSRFFFMFDSVIKYKLKNNF
jgi:hypothetical protein